MPSFLRFTNIYMNIYIFLNISDWPFLPLHSPTPLFLEPRSPTPHQPPLRLRNTCSVAGGFLKSRREVEKYLWGLETNPGFWSGRFWTLHFSSSEPRVASAGSRLMATGLRGFTRGRLTGVLGSRRRLLSCP